MGVVVAFENYQLGSQAAGTTALHLVSCLAGQSLAAKVKGHSWRF